MADDPLRSLMVDAAALDREQIARALSGRLGLDQTSGGAVVLSGFDALSVRQKILAILLMRKAAALLDVAEDDALSSTVVRDQSGIPGGTVRRTLPELAAAHAVTQGPDGRYRLANPQVRRAIEEISAEPGAQATSSRSRPARRRAKPARRDATDAGGGEVDRKEAEGAVGAPARGSARSTGAGPSALVAELLGAGFFGEPRTVAEVQREIKDRRGYNVPTNNLTPHFTRLLRREVLVRTRDESGVYRYVTPDAAS